MNFRVGDYFYLENGNVFMLESIDYLHEFSYNFCPIRPWIRVEEGKMKYSSSDYQRISLKYFDIFKYFCKMNRFSYGYLAGPMQVINEGQGGESCRKTISS